MVHGFRQRPARPDSCPPARRPESCPADTVPGHNEMPTAGRTFLMEWCPVEKSTQTTLLKAMEVPPRRPRAVVASADGHTSVPVGYEEDTSCPGPFRKNVSFTRDKEWRMVRGFKDRENALLITLQGPMHFVKTTEEVKQELEQTLLKRMGETCVVCSCESAMDIVQLGCSHWCCLEHIEAPAAPLRRGNDIICAACGAVTPGLPIPVVQRRDCKMSHRTAVAPTIRGPGV